MALRLDSEIQYLKGVGPKLGALFQRHGVSTIQDLFYFFPRAYEDRRAARNIASLKPDETVSLQAQIANISSYTLGRTRKKIFDVLLRDSSGQIHCKYFRVPYKGYFERFKPFDTVRVIGKVQDYRGKLEMHHPDIRDLEPEDENQKDVLNPIYTEIEGFASQKILKLIRTAWEQVKNEEWPETFPKSLLEKYKLLTKKQSLYKLHYPDPEDSENLFNVKSEAQRRIIFEEFFWLELYLAAKKMGFQSENALHLRPYEQQISTSTTSLANAMNRSTTLIKSLPFQLTEAQKRTLKEVQHDLSQSHPMHRLIQGDVGSGKTMVAFLASVWTIDAGAQACLMAPTEILAEQHFKNAQKFLTPLGIECALLTGKTKTSERKIILENLLQNKIHFLIGTHALIEDWVLFKELALVIIDEQHRFGVEQRGQLKSKGANGLTPHFLVMTATPIPRTLAMTVYGDLDVSIIDELPPGRTPIQTRVAYEAKRTQALDFMSEQIAKGRQAYIIYPLVEESEKIDLKNAVDEFDFLQKQYPKIRFGLLHGRMKAEEKEAIMNSFRQKEFDVLVSTTVIEVGVDVPNANIIIIEHAERFGLSQLHQLRGRVGRGEHKSFCILMMGYAVSEDGKRRLEFMESTTDGFKLAEFDLEIRGPGEFLGTRQSGLSGFNMANIVRDAEILHQAREAAFAVLQKDPNLKWPDHAKLREQLTQKHGAAFLASIA